MHCINKAAELIFTNSPLLLVDKHINVVSFLFYLFDKLKVFKGIYINQDYLWWTLRTVKSDENFVKSDENFGG